MIDFRGNKTTFVMDTKQEVKVLSERELEVLQLSAEGHSLKQIAEMLSISIDTVDTHSRNVVNRITYKLCDPILFKG